MAWKKNAPEAIRRFDELASVPGATRKMMFGCPVYELGGKRYALLHGNRVVLALSPEHTAKLIERGGRAWEPMEGRRSKHKVVPEAIAESVRSLRVWVQRAVQHVHAQSA
jgi:TfoX-like protein